MPVEKLNIEKFIGLTRQFPVLDVRSPAEYNHAHLPGAISMPLFNDEERKIVGTAYKQESREVAIKIGLDFFGPKMKKMVEQAEEIIQKGSSTVNGSKTLLIYCWRGGMRSAGVAWLMDLYGFKVYTLAGGYKSFRNHILKSFTHPYQFNIIGGFTGSGKTETLQELSRMGEAVIDLEDIAKHKGSAFGNIGMPKQPGQEMFENLLGMALLEKMDRNQPIWLEDESQRIGDLNLPGSLWNMMRAARIFFLDIPFEKRLDHIVEEYGTLDIDRMVGAIDRIKQRLGGLEAKNATTHLLEGNIRESFRILLTYYDKWYLKGLHNRETVETLLTKISCDEVNPLNAKQLVYRPAYENR